MQKCCSFSLPHTITVYTAWAAYHSFSNAGKVVPSPRRPHPDRPASFLLSSPPSRPSQSTRIGWNCSHHKYHFPHKVMQTKGQRGRNCCEETHPPTHSTPHTHTHTFSLDRWCYETEAHPPGEREKYRLTHIHTADMAAGVTIGRVVCKHLKRVRLQLQLCWLKLYDFPLTKILLMLTAKTPTSCGLHYCNDCWPIFPVSYFLKMKLL